MRGVLHGRLADLLAPPGTVDRLIDDLFVQLDLRSGGRAQSIVTSTTFPPLFLERRHVIEELPVLLVSLSGLLSHQFRVSLSFDLLEVLDQLIIARPCLLWGQATNHRH